MVSDGSTDQTRTALASYCERGAIRLIEVPAGGKPLALNAGVAAATGELLVFADARQRFCDRALTALAANFADPTVGGATGELVLDCESGDSTSTIGDGVGAYWKYEKWLRRHEGAIWSTLGATGAIYALRRSLWQPLPAETLLDDVLAPMRAVLSGWRVVFEEEATADRSHRSRCGGRGAPETADARRQLPDPRAGAAPARAVRQPGVAAVPVAQGRTVAGALGARSRCS